MQLIDCRKLMVSNQLLCPTPGRKTPSNFNATCSATRRIHINSADHLLRKNVIRVLPNCFTNCANNALDGLGGRAIGEVVHKALAIVACHTDTWIQGDSSKEWDTHLLRQPTSSASSLAEDLRLVCAVWANEARHVLHQTQDLDACLTTEVDFLADI